jgi:hypothetical protein
LDGFEVIFATERGAVAKADQLTIKSLSRSLIFTLSQARWLYHCKVCSTERSKRILHRLVRRHREQEPIALLEMEASSNFQHPISWKDINPTDYNGLLLAGGHAPGTSLTRSTDNLQNRHEAVLGKSRIATEGCCILEFE